jgi:SAM-dependent methyltransferase
MRAYSPIGRRVANRSSGIEAEVNFWDGWLEQRGGVWAAEYDRRIRGVCDPGPVTDHLKEGITVLDVGSGPFSSLGGTTDQGVKFALTCIDPLGDRYLPLYAKHGIYPSAKPFPIEAESAAASLAGQTFDLVHARNSIDHSSDARRAIASISKLVKPNGRLILSHHRNEAKREGFRGLHRWNFDISNDELTIEGVDGVKTIVAELLDGTFERESLVELKLDSSEPLGGETLFTVYRNLYR